MTNEAIIKRILLHSGSYFGSHFMMGGERFEMGQSEAYLFGDNTDLNFLGAKPVQVH